MGVLDFSIWQCPQLPSDIRTLIQRFMKLKVFSCCFKLILPCQVDRHNFNKARLCLFMWDSQHRVHAATHGESKYVFHRQLFRPSGLTYSSPIRILESEDLPHLSSREFKTSWLDRCPLDTTLQCRPKHRNHFPLDTRITIYLFTNHTRTWRHS